MNYINAEIKALMTSTLRKTIIHWEIDEYVHKITEQWWIMRGMLEDRILILIVSAPQYRGKAEASNKLADNYSFQAKP